MKRVVLFLLFSVAAANICYADTIVLKSGKTLEAIVTEKMDDSIKVDIGGVAIKYYLDEVESINGEKVNTSAPQALKEETDVSGVENAVVDEPPKSLEAQQKTEELITEELPVKQEESFDETTDDKETAFDTTNDAQTSSTPEQTSEASRSFSDFTSTKTQSYQNNNESSSVMDEQKVRPKASAFSSKYSANLARGIKLKAMMGIMALVGIVVIATLIFSLLCLYFIAKKTNTEPAWLTLIPIANLFLMCKIAGISYLWLLLVLAGFIPIVGAFVSIGFTVFMWYKIALARGKNGWLGLLMIVPIAGMVVMGYLAFSE